MQKNAYTPAYTPLNVKLNYFKLLKHFCVVMYDKTAQLMKRIVLSKELHNGNNSSNTRCFDTVPMMNIMSPMVASIHVPSASQCTWHIVYSI